MLDQSPVTIEENRWPLVLWAFFRESLGEEISSIAFGTLQRFLGSDIEVIAAPSPASHPTDESRKYIEAKIEGHQRGNFPVGSSINNVEACICKVAGWRFGLLDEGDDSPISV